MPTCRDEVLDAVRALLTRNGGRPVAPAEVVREMARRGSRYPESTVRTHVVAHMSGPGGPLRRVDRGLYALATADEPPSQPAEAGGPKPAARTWPWEGAVQALFAAHLEAHGWQITAAADTATKARGVDLLAAHGQRRLGAEVKGWPSTRYADPRRVDEPKPTQPTTQAGHWFAQALLKAIMLLDSHPGHQSLIVLPDYPRYRDLTARTRTGREAAGVHVVLIDRDGLARSDTWSA